MRLRLSTKIIIAVFGMLALVAALAGFLAERIEQQTLLQLSEASAATTVRLVLRDLEGTMLTGRAEVTRESVQALQTIPGVSRIHILGRDGRPALGSRSGGADGALLSTFARGRREVITRHGHEVTVALPLVGRWTW